MKAEAAVVDPRNEDTVMRYLRENPDFFGRHPMLLTDLSLPHDSGEAISLVERQVAILRERNIDMRRRLTHLVGAANTNDTLFEKTRRFTLKMLDCDDARRHRRGARRYAHRRFCRRLRALLRLAPARVRVASSPDLLQFRAAELPLLQLTQTTGLSCGLLRGDEFSTLFGEAAAIDGSAALIQLQPRRSDRRARDRQPRSDALQSRDGHAVHPLHRRRVVARARALLIGDGTR